MASATAPAFPRARSNGISPYSELLFVIRRVAAWSSNLTTRAVATPKITLVDSGLGGHLIGMSLKRARHPSAPVGPLLENFVLGELVAIEVKAAETVRRDDFRGIDRLARRVGDDLVAGIVLYAGPQPLSFGDQLRALPISALWTARPAQRA
ncbi:MAG: DUF4143 domain-containing protein [Trebonia sp.]